MGAEWTDEATAPKIVALVMFALLVVILGYIGSQKDTSLLESENGRSTTG